MTLVPRTLVTDYDVRSVALNPLFDGHLHVWLDDAWPPETAGQDWIQRTPTATWGSVEGLRFSTTMPGGFASCSWQIHSTTPTQAYWGVYKGYYVKVTHSALTLFEGRIVEVIPTSGPEGVVQFECGGFYDVMGSNEAYCRTWVDSDISAWIAHPESGSQYDLTNDICLRVKAEARRKYAYDNGAGFYYPVNGFMRPDQHATAVTADFVENLDDANWTWYVDGHTNWLNTLNAGSPFYSRSNETDDLNDWGVPCQGWTSHCLFAYLWNAENPPAELSAAQYIRFNDLEVHCGSKYGSVTSVTAHGTAPVVTTAADHLFATDDTVVFADLSAGTADPPLNAHEYIVTVTGARTFTVLCDNDDARTGGYWACTSHPTIDRCMSDIVADVFSDTVTYDTETIGSPLGHARIMPFTTPRDALDEFASQAVTRFDYGFWDGFTFRCKALSDPDTTTNHWHWDEEASGFTWDIHTDTETQIDHVTILYLADGSVATYPKGQPKILSVPAAPTGTDRVALLDLSEVMMTATEADNAADQYLLWAKSDVHSGSAECSTGYVTRGDSVVKPAAYVRAGQYVVGTNYSATKLLITETEYDVESATLTLSVGGYRPDFVYVPPVRARKHWHWPGRTKPR